MALMAVHWLTCDECGATKSLRSSMSDAEAAVKALRIDAITEGWHFVKKTKRLFCPRCV